MAGPSRRRRVSTILRCTECEHEFRGLARFVLIEPADLGPLQWRAADNAAMGHRCSQCGSESIVAVNPLTPP